MRRQSPDEGTQAAAEARVMSEKQVSKSQLHVDAFACAPTRLQNKSTLSSAVVQSRSEPSFPSVLRRGHPKGTSIIF